MDVDGSGCVCVWMADGMGAPGGLSLCMGLPRYNTDPTFPETRATGMSCVKKASGRRAGLRRPPWDWCFHFYWSLARKLGDPLWNGRPRIVPSLWGDHSTAARTVALSPSNSYRLGRYLYAWYVHRYAGGRGRVWAFRLEGWI